MENKDFYDNFKEKLDSNHKFPSTYTFKFIILNNVENVSEIEGIFRNSNAKIEKKLSKNEKYISCSISIYVIDSEEIISYYKKASEIENIILL